MIGAQVITKLTGWYIILFSVLAEAWRFNLEADVLPYEFKLMDKLNEFDVILHYHGFSLNWILCFDGVI